MYRQSEKNLLNSNITPTCPYNMVNFGPLAAEIVSSVWGTPANFKGFRVLAAYVTARYSSSGRQPNFAVLNRGHHLYSAGRPSHWALDHILVHKCCRCSSTTTDPCFHSRFLSNTCIASHRFSVIYCAMSALRSFNRNRFFRVWCQIFHLALQFERYVCE